MSPFGNRRSFPVPRRHSRRYTASEQSWPRCGSRISAGLVELGAPLGSRWLGQSRWNDLRFFLRRKLVGDDIIAHNYRHLVTSMIRRQPPGYPRFPCVTPSWDNSARRTRGASVFIGSSPALFEQWAEGNHLEPDQRYGSSYLEALREALQSVDGG